MHIMKEKKPPKMMQHVRQAAPVAAEPAPADDDAVLWQAVTRDVTKWDKSNKMGRPEEKPVSNPPASKSKIKYVPVMTGQITLESFASITKPASPSSYQLDGALQKRFTNGELPIDGTIDLHGLTLAEAHQQFMRFMSRKITGGARCVLIITGKGSSETENGRGVIRKNLPLWCEDKSIGLHILKLSKASPRHGGSGAFYILIRRQR